MQYIVELFCMKVNKTLVRNFLSTVNSKMRCANHQPKQMQRKEFDFQKARADLKDLLILKTVTFFYMFFSSSFIA